MPNRKLQLFLMSLCGFAAIGSVGCVREVASRPANFVIRAMGIRRPNAPAPNAVKTAKRQPPQVDNYHSVFDRQTKGAYNPLTDNRRVAQLQARLRVDPGDLPSRIELAGIFERYGVNDRAFDEYSLAAETLASPAKSAASPSRAELEPAAKGLARTALASGEASGAIPVIDAVLKRSPSLKVWDELGMLHDSLGDLASGERAFRRSVALVPASAVAHNNLGYNLLLQKKADAAEPELRRAVAIDPKFSAARNNLGTLLVERGDFPGAFEQFRLGAADLAEAHNNFAVVLLERGQYERGRDELIQALKAKYYFAPAMENYKLAMDMLRQRAEMVGAGRGLPLTSAHLSSLLGETLPHVELMPVSPANEQGENRSE